MLPDLPDVLGRFSKKQPALLSRQGHLQTETARILTEIFVPALAGPLQA